MAKLDEMADIAMCFHYKSKLWRHSGTVSFNPDTEGETVDLPQNSLDIQSHDL